MGPFINRIQITFLHCRLVLKYRFGGVRRTKESEKYEALAREDTQSSRSVLANGMFSRNVPEKKLKIHGRLLVNEQEHEPKKP